MDDAFIFKLILGVASAMACSQAARAGGGDWAPTVVCSTQNDDLNLSWSYLVLGESLVGRQIGIQLSGEDEGLPYLVSSEKNLGSTSTLKLAARTGYSEPNTKYPLGPNVLVKLGQHWKFAELTSEDGQIYILKCGN